MKIITHTQRRVKNAWRAGEVRMCKGPVKSRKFDGGENLQATKNQNSVDRAQVFAPPSVLPAMSSRSDLFRLFKHIHERANGTGMSTTQDSTILRLDDSLSKQLSNCSIGRGRRFGSKGPGSNPASVFFLLQCSVAMCPPAPPAGSA